MYWILSNWIFLIWLPNNIFGLKELFNRKICDGMRDLVPFVQFKNVKNIHGGEKDHNGIYVTACNWSLGIHNKSLNYRQKTFFFLKKQNELLYYVTIKTLNSKLWLRTFEHFYFVLMLTSWDILLPQADLGLLQHSRWKFFR